MNSLNRHGYPWTRHEDVELLKSVRRERSVDCEVFAKHHGRSQSAITSRLRVLAKAEAGHGVYGIAWPGRAFETPMDYTRRQASGYSARAAKALWSDPEFRDRAEAYLLGWYRRHDNRNPAPFGDGYRSSPKTASWAEQLRDAMGAVQPHLNVRAYDAQDEAMAKAVEEIIHGQLDSQPKYWWQRPSKFDYLFSDLKTKETEMDCASSEYPIGAAGVDLTKKFYVVLTTTSMGSREFSVPLPLVEAEKMAKARASQHPLRTCYILESVSVSTLGKVRTSALKPAPKPKKVKPLKVKRGTPIEYVD